MSNLEAKREALKNYLESDETPECLYHSDTEFECESEEWLLCTDQEADELAAEYIRDTLWAFNPTFLLDYIDAPLTEVALIKIQEEMCEDANDVIAALVRDNIEDLIVDAISADGRGHFLSGYDGEEVEMGDFFGYRRN